MSDAITRVRDLVTEIGGSISRAAETLGYQPVECLVGKDEWRELSKLRPVIADQDWHVSIRGVPVRPLGF